MSSGRIYGSERDNVIAPSVRFIWVQYQVLKCDFCRRFGVEGPLRATKCAIFKAHSGATGVETAHKMICSIHNGSKTNSIECRIVVIKTIKSKKWRLAAVDFTELFLILE